MPEYLAPGVYVEEVSSGNKPIAGVDTSTAGFVGATERGPLAPQFISSWLEFQRMYGGYIPEQSYLAYAIEGFFNNGGQQCFVTRVTGANAKNAFTSVAADNSKNKLNVVAIGPGEWGNNVRIALTRNPDSLPPETVNFLVEYTDSRGKTEVKEVHENLTHIAGANNNLVKVVNSASKYVRVWWNDPNAAEKPSAEEVKPGAQITLWKNLEKGHNGDPLTASNFTGNAEPVSSGHGAALVVPDELLGRSTGLGALELIDEVAILVVPDEVNGKIENASTVRDAAVAQCSKLQDRFAVCSIEQGRNDISDLHPPMDTTNAAVYYPWIKVYDPLGDNTRLIPPAGHIAGIYARTDIERGVHKAPANEVVRGAIDLEFPVTKQTQDLLNPRNVNCIRDFRSDGRGIRVWGARTMGSDPEWKYINTRRLFLFVQESIDEGIQWVVFEPNDESTWNTVRRNLSDFLTSLWQNGALMGVSPEEAFFVGCDRTTMTQDDIDTGKLICVIGVALEKPAEFVIFRISQKTADVG